MEQYTLASLSYSAQAPQRDLAYLAKLFPQGQEASPEGVPLQSARWFLGVERPSSLSTGGSCTSVVGILDRSLPNRAVRSRLSRKRMSTESIAAREVPEPRELQCRIRLSSHHRTQAQAPAESDSSSEPSSSQDVCHQVLRASQAHKLYTSAPAKSSGTLDERLYMARIKVEPFISQLAVEFALVIVHVFVEHSHPGMSYNPEHVQFSTRLPVSR